MPVSKKIKEDTIPEQVKDKPLVIKGGKKTAVVEEPVVEEKPVAKKGGKKTTVVEEAPVAKIEEKTVAKKAVKKHLLKNQ